MASDTTAQRVVANVRAEMARRRCTQEQLAVSLGKTQQFVSRRLNGRVPFTISELDEIAGALEVPLSNLIGEAVA